MSLRIEWDNVHKLLPQSPSYDGELSINGSGGVSLFCDNYQFQVSISLLAYDFCEGWDHILLACVSPVLMDSNK